MGLKKRNKVSAEFSMSSLTDIIFLLLIFFMLTSTLVKIHPFELPTSDSKTVANTDIVIAINKDGEHFINDLMLPKTRLESQIRRKVREAEAKENINLTIVAEVGTPFDHVVNVMKIAGKLRIKAIIATQPTS
ncbi:MAG: biopolymer transporter ExbD [Bacteroidota bacterium]